MSKKKIIRCHITFEEIITGLLILLDLIKDDFIPVIPYAPASSYHSY
jgi:hypothetical protein